jgi:hypothetical protein
MELKIDAVTAAKDVAAYQNKNLNGRRIPKPIALIEKLRRENPVHIFSLSPWPHTISMGSWGAFTIPACPEDKEYIEFLMIGPDGNKGPVPGVMIQTYVDAGNQLALYEEDGREWAIKLLQNDLGIPKYASLNRYGIFVAKGSEPTKDELAAAKKELHSKLQEIVAEARKMWNDPKSRDHISIEKHHYAASKLGLNEPYLVDGATAGARQKCEICGQFSEAGVLKCPCGDWIFDTERYGALLKKQAQAIEAAQE